MEATDDFEVVAVNDLTDPAALAHLLKYDTVQGRFQGTVKLDDGHLMVNGRKVEVLSEREPAKLPWKPMELDYVVESTGIFRTRDLVAKHLDAGAPRVLLTVPPKDAIDNIIVMGVNQEQLKKEDKIISNASCTTNCLAPVAKVLHEVFGIRYGLMTTTHAYTNDQRISDLVHKDLRRARAAAQNIIPTTTGAAKAVGKVIPELNGKLDGFAMRVPVIDGSVVDLTVMVDKKATQESINTAVKAAADGPMKGILAYTEDPIVSSDIIGDNHSSIFDGLSTMVMADNMVKVVSWYDNEWGYSCRVVDLIRLSCSL
jgi:glyceraldehyde 3-phosphate dehydrogenase